MPSLQPVALHLGEAALAQRLGKSLLRQDSFAAAATPVPIRFIKRRGSYFERPSELTAVVEETPKDVHFTAVVVSGRLDSCRQAQPIPLPVKAALERPVQDARSNSALSFSAR